MPEQIWKLKHADAVIGEIHITDGDFPGLSGAFVPLPGFADFKPLFDRELELWERLCDGPGPDADDAATSYRETYDLIRSTLTLVDSGGVPAAEFLLHIDGSEAWFRWSNTPFDEAP